MVSKVWPRLWCFRMIMMMHSAIVAKLSIMIIS